VALKYTFYFPSISFMNNTKINKLLKALPSNVVAKFGKTLLDKTNGQRLFSYLNNDKKDVNDIDKITKYVFKTKHANPEKDLHNEGSKLYIALQDWLIAEELKADELTKNQLLSNALKGYKATDAYLEALKGREKLIVAQPARDSAYHWSQMRLSHARYFHPQTDFSSMAAEDNFTKAVQHLDEFYLRTRMLYIAERNMRNSNYDINITIPRQSEMLRPTYEDKPLVQICMLAAKLIQSPDNEIFRTEFCPLMEEYIHLADLENQGTLATYRINYTSKQTQKGHADFMRDQFEAYQFGIENGYLEHEGHLDETHFLNAVTVAAVLNKFEAGRQLIRNHAVRLKDNAEGISKLANSYLYFYQSLFMEAYNELPNESFANAQTDLRCRSLKAQCMYELILQGHKNVNRNLLICHLDAYQKFLKRAKKISKNTRQSNLNFINLFKKMVNKLDKAKALLEGFLRTDEPIILKKWLSDIVNR